MEVQKETKLADDRQHRFESSVLDTTETNGSTSQSLFLLFQEVQNTKQESNHFPIHPKQNVEEDEEESDRYRITYLGDIDEEEPKLEKQLYFTSNSMAEETSPAKHMTTKPFDNKDADSETATTATASLSSPSASSTSSASCIMPPSVWRASSPPLVLQGADSPATITPLKQKKKNNTASSATEPFHSSPPLKEEREPEPQPRKTAAAPGSSSSRFEWLLQHRRASKSAPGPSQQQHPLQKAETQKPQDAKHETRSASTRAFSLVRRLASKAKRPSSSLTAPQDTTTTKTGTSAPPPPRGHRMTAQEGQLRARARVLLRQRLHQQTQDETKDSRTTKTKTPSTQIPPVRSHRAVTVPQGPTLQTAQRSNHRTTRGSASTSRSRPVAPPLNTRKKPSSSKPTTVAQGPKLQTEQRVVDRTLHLQYSRPSLQRPVSPRRRKPPETTVPQGPQLRTAHRMQHRQEQERERQARQEELEREQHRQEEERIKQVAAAAAAAPHKPIRIRKSTKPLTVPQGPNLRLHAKYGHKLAPRVDVDYDSSCYSSPSMIRRSTTHNSGSCYSSASTTARQRRPTNPTSRVTPQTLVFDAEADRTPTLQRAEPVPYHASGESVSSSKASPRRSSPHKSLRLPSSSSEASWSPPKEVLVWRPPTRTTMSPSPTKTPKRSSHGHVDPLSSPPNPSSTTNAPAAAASPAASTTSSNTSTPSRTVMHRPFMRGIVEEEIVFAG